MSKYSRLSGNPEELLENDTLGDLGIEHIAASIDQDRRLSERKGWTLDSDEYCCFQYVLTLKSVMLAVVNQ